MTMKASCLLQKFRLQNSTFHLQIRWTSANGKIKLNDEVEKLVETDTIKPRHHPGIIKNYQVQLPKWITEAMRLSLEDVDLRKLRKEQKELANYLFSRQLPPEEEEVKDKYINIEEKFLGDISRLSEDEIIEKKTKIKGKVLLRLRQKTFAWKAIDYNNYKSLLYMATRSTPEYAVLRSIFNEIQTRDPDFNPQTIFDFGSGVGTVLWAATERWKKISEYMGVDISNDMNDLSAKIIGQSPSKFKNVFYRRYLPVSNIKYDLVVSAYSFMELPDAKSRLKTIAKLWKKTNKYLIIVEQGTNAGFKLVNEARDFVNHVMQKFEPNTKYFTFAPCPHDLSCPRFEEGQTPCNFITSYLSLPFFGPSNATNELFSYVILKKGERQDNDNWNRLVRPTLLRSRHIRCRMCTKSGKLEEIVFTKSKFGRTLYRCAKASKWGDRLPLQEISESTTNDQNELNSEILEDKNQYSDTESEIQNADEKKEKQFFSKAPVFSNKNDDL